MRFRMLKAFGICAEGLWTGWGGRRRIEAKQLSRLRCLVELARREAPLFQDLYKDLPPSEDILLQDLPVTKKRDLMARFDQWLTDRSLTLAQVWKYMADPDNLGRPIGNVAVFRTSGSSGEPAVVVVPELMLEFTVAITFARMDRAMMTKLLTVARSGTNATVAGGSGHFAGIGLSRLMQTLIPRLGERMHFIPAELPIAEIVAWLNAVGPIGALTTYPSMMMILVREKEAGRLKVAPKLIKTAGETLTDELRTRVARAFPSTPFPILNAYASTECFLLGIVCAAGRQHLPEDWVILEAVDHSYRPVEDGVLSDTALLTTFANDIQPFIRYDLGDRIRYYKEACPCGSPFRSFEVEGRQATLIRIKGVELSPLVFDLEHEKAQRVQLVQTAETQFDIRLELREPADKVTVFQDLRTSVLRVFQANHISDVKVSLSDKLPELGASGKFHEVLPFRHL